MNFLAHFFLSNEIENIIVGNFLGDFVRGKQYKNYPNEVAKGILLHRQIDTFTDKHPVVLQTNQRLHKSFRKYAPVITDIYYDHFLGVHFNKYNFENQSKDSELSSFAVFIYQTLEKNYELLPSLAQQVFLRMKKQDWLFHYSTLYGMEQSLNGLSRRAKYATHLHEAFDFLKQNYSTIENDFLLFFPDIIQFVQEKLNE
ncbi:ACP phosphodiesterase [Bernardetia sp.]|uniref:acyl carrier protein phosphodiesterase n=1 Tax=Bernardetia sp. TaxID=1937974 RepID=UPI0025BF1BF9|nr:ACP phosphodiesterase [Bernardetia sp.]